MTLQIGVKVLIQNSAGDYLFIKRSEGLADGGGIRWDVPGGRISSDETLHHALQREVIEETKLTLSSNPVLLHAQDIFIHNKGVHVIRLTYQAQVIDTDITLSNEHGEHQWVSLTNAMSLSLDDYMRETLKLLSK